ncbi:hypothetical protein [Rhodoferax sp.]|uniref:hypothetical protein n=1 Tax=Rhodoferax sp. TaxID=50421 RepID=UPI00261919FE|nr:hypothetical protein [Rhodoferax sp.]MDD2661758.1 hypothetical protein [Methylococcales bacterium]MDD5480301.1 hypothetical protein [Rhodoferax sp.]
MRTRKLLVAVILAHLAPVTAWAAFKPIRVLAPELLGLHCSSQGVCVDDLARLGEATALKAEAAAFVGMKVGRISHVPRAVFCSTAECAKAFGFTHQGAYNVGTFGLAISPRGWHPHFVRHELIHHLQNERLGTLNAWFFKPNWLLEGMAYSLSEDPRRPLPQPLEGWRSRFEQWLPSIGNQSIWQAAEKVQ